MTEYLRPEAQEDAEGQEEQATEPQQATEDLWVGAADTEAKVGRGSPPICKNNSSLVYLGPIAEAFLNWFEAGSTKVPEDELIWLTRGALARSTSINYIKVLRHYFQWAMEEQGADETWSPLDRFEWETIKNYMDRFSISPYLVF